MKCQSLRSAVGINKLQIGWEIFSLDPFENFIQPRDQYRM